MVELRFFGGLTHEEVADSHGRVAAHRQQRAASGEGLALRSRRRPRLIPPLWRQAGH
jgi:hypothetical protein